SRSALARIPTDPRLARALLDGSALVGVQLAAEVVALIGGDGRGGDADVAAAVVALRNRRGPDAACWAREVDRMLRFTPDGGRTRTSIDDVGVVIALAFPERVARRVERSADGATFLLASGTRAAVRGSLAGAEWLAVADVARASGRAAAGAGAVVRAAASLTESQAAQAADHLLTDRVEAEFVGGRITARRERRLGAVVLSSVPMRATAEEGRGAVRRALQSHGLDVFTWSDAAVDLRRRLALLHREVGAPWPDVSEAALLADLDSWLTPEIDALASGTPAGRLNLASALRRLLPWPAAADFDE